MTEQYKITDKEVRYLAHIPDEEVDRDLRDTYLEIDGLRSRIEGAKEEIAMREKLVAKLLALRAARACERDKNQDG